MIAIAGAKGGCGKTVTTIGLTEAFARTGAPAVAVDADRQLPNLHVTAGVDREPTLATLASSSSTAESAALRKTLETAIQPSPRTAAAGIVPAPTPSERADVKSILESLERETMQTFVDCPSGAGPDVVEPLSAASGVIVVTTGTERSISAAETTVEMARRLEVPLLGTVLNRCESAPEAVESWLDVPILGLIPDVDEPLSDDAARDAYGAVIETLRTHNATTRTPPAYDEDRLATGIDALDHRLGGGLAPGTLAALVADPASQSEQLLYEMTEPRGTLYLSTERSAANVRRAVEAVSVETGTPTVRRVAGDDALEEATALFEKLPRGATLLVDPIAELERRERSAYVSFLNDLKERLVETEGIALLHCLRAPNPPANRTATTHAVDAVFDLRTTSAGLADGTGIDHHVSVTKFRAESGFAETIDLELGDATPAPVEPTPTPESERASEDATGETPTGG